jgi:hypothetical protein
LRFETDQDVGSSKQPAGESTRFAEAQPVFPAPPVGTVQLSAQPSFGASGSAGIGVASGAAVR